MKYLMPLAAFIFLATACASTQKNLQSNAQGVQAGTPAAAARPDNAADPLKLPAPATASSKDMFGQAEIAGLKIVHFEFDRSDLTDEDRKALEADSEFLQAHPNQKIVVEGHCDERGSAEYNMALGERRAKAVRDYLTLLGVDHSRMEIISYGSEQPVDTDHNEDAWAMNRRAQFRSLQ